MSEITVFANGRLFDPESKLDVDGDLAIDGGRIMQVGNVKVDGSARVVDVAGSYVAPGFIDVHAHVFGPIGFASSDSIGVHAGVTTICDAGGAAFDTVDDFLTQVVEESATDVYSWLYLGSGGLDTATVDSRSRIGIRNKIPVLELDQLLDAIERHGERIIGLKLAAFGEMGRPGPMKLAKGVALIADRPLYLHLGDLQLPPDKWSEAIEPALDELGPGDVITHCYTPNPGALVDRELKLVPAVAAALDRGVILDVGFGAFNFDFNVAASLLEQGVMPFTISSDLQQANVLGPVHSLVNVMSAFLALGVSLDQVVQRVTANAAELLRKESFGRLLPGMAADLTIFDLQAGETAFRDTVGGELRGEQKILPRLAVKNGAIHEIELDKATAQQNWSQNSVLAEEDIPDAVAGLKSSDRQLLASVGRALEAETEWLPRSVHRAVRQAVANGDLGHADRVILSAFMHHVFPQAPGYFMASLDRDFVLGRLKEAAEG